MIINSPCSVLGWPAIDAAFALGASRIAAAAGVQRGCHCSDGSQQAEVYFDQHLSLSQQLINGQ